MISRARERCAILDCITKSEGAGSGEDAAPSFYLKYFFPVDVVLGVLGSVFLGLLILSK